jgi:transcriptional regulator with XRE-family HTH domain
VKRTRKGPLRDLLAKNMRRLRAERGLSQEALAHECRINGIYLSGVERSERNVSIDNIARIARWLGVEAWNHPGMSRITSSKKIGDEDALALGRRPDLRR